jgi:hypothetical protein
MNYLIGIDPDLHFNGFALYCKETKEFTNIQAITIWGLFDWILELSKTSQIKVLLEYPENTYTYHKGGKGAALNVGKNQAVAIIIKEFLEFFKIETVLLKPKGYSKYFNDVKFFKLQTNWQKQTNKDARAAAAIVFLNK